MHVCALPALLLPKTYPTYSKTCTSHAHSSFVSFHPKPVLSRSLANSLSLSLSYLRSLRPLSSVSPPGHFSYHAVLCIIRGVVCVAPCHTKHVLIPPARITAYPRRRGIASKFATPSSSNELADVRFFPCDDESFATFSLPLSFMPVSEVILISKCRHARRFVSRTNDVTTRRLSCSAIFDLKLTTRHNNNNFTDVTPMCGEDVTCETDT